MWIVYAVLSAIAAGITTIFLKKGIHTTNTNVALALRTLVVLIFSIVIVLIIGSYKEIYYINTKTWVFLILSGLSTGAGWYYYYKALQIGNVKNVSPLSKSSLVLTIILSFILLNEEITLLKIISLIIITLGTYYIIDYKKTEEKKENNNKWIIYALLSLIFSALTPIFGKIGIENVESNLGTSIRVFVVVISAWLILFIKKEYKEIKNINKSEIKYIIISGITGGSSWLLYYKALQNGITSAVAAIDKLSVLVAVILSYFIFNEKMKVKEVIGLILILIGTIGLAFKI